ncbi:hypothetical protein GALMADRAFT_238744 [Galerina marginata CBS 339.88]|uniref:Uncharacterized protein n=1 Tax=Galerina marginata (strain CBS 339.88) TaxID=685588 RepID=A0A067TIH5_GALM3|nr:hypothetical protein GALMADRAFT_238744 [Galerina marginata CBS 339.88]
MSIVVRQNSALGYFGSGNDICTSHSSDQIKTACHGLRNETRDKSAQRVAERYKTQQRFSLAHARSLICVAHQCVTFQHDQETQLLLNLVDSESGVKHTHQTALDVATLAKHTLMAEEDLALSRLKECELMLIMLKDAAKEARVHVTQANNQVGNLVSYLDSRSLPLRRTFQATNSLIHPSVLSTYKSHLETYLPDNRHTTMTSTMLTTSPIDSSKSDELDDAIREDNQIAENYSSSSLS